MSHGAAIILTDGKAGHENQSRAFARALGFGAPEIVPVAFKSRFAKALSYLLDRLGVHTLSLLAPFEVCREPRTTSHEPRTTNHEPRVVIATGSGTFYAAKALARKLGAKCGVVLYPRGYRLSGFDCILAPSFDRPASAPNVVEIPANLVTADSAFYDAGEKAFRERHAPSSKPAVAVIVGGPNKCSSMKPDWMKRELDKIFAEKGVEFWVTTSRRTPAEVEALVDAYPWDYKLLYSRDHFNPIPAFVKLARTLYVTAESTGMISEACTSGGAEVKVLDNLNPGPHKFRRFVEGLAASGYVNGSRKVDLSAAFSRARSLLGL